MFGIVADYKIGVMKNVLFFYTIIRKPCFRGTRTLPPFDYYLYNRLAWPCPRKIEFCVQCLRFLTNYYLWTEVYTHSFRVLTKSNYFLLSYASLSRYVIWHKGKKNPSELHIVDLKPRNEGFSTVQVSFNSYIFLAKLMQLLGNQILTFHHRRDSQ